MRPTGATHTLGGALLGPHTLGGALHHQTETFTQTDPGQKREQLPPFQEQTKTMLSQCVVERELLLLAGPRRFNI